MTKTFRGLSELRQILHDRGLTIVGGTISDDSGAETHLYDSNYYRFSGYARQFQPDTGDGDQSFMSGTRYADIQVFMARDTEFRLLLFEALSVVEVCVRSRFAHEAGAIFGSGAFYLDSETYLDITPRLTQHIEKMRTDLLRPKLATVARYRNGEDLSAVPLWVAIEHMSFGTVAKMIGYFRDISAAKTTSEKLSVPWEGFHSTNHSFSILRNICAHHGQLWNRRIDITAPVLGKLKRFEPKYDNGSVYATIIMLKKYVRMIDAQSDWPARVDLFLDLNPDFAAGIYHPTPK